MHAFEALCSSDDEDCTTHCDEERWSSSSPPNTALQWAHHRAVIKRNTHTVPASSTGDHAPCRNVLEPATSHAVQSEAAEEAKSVEAGKGITQCAPGALSAVAHLHYRAHHTTQPAKSAQTIYMFVV